MAFGLTVFCLLFKEASGGTAHVGSWLFLVGVKAQAQASWPEGLCTLTPFPYVPEWASMLAGLRTAMARGK